MNDSTIRDFWRWFHSHSKNLLSQDDQTIVDQLHHVLNALDDAIAVEIATDTAGGHPVKEVIISGSGDEAAMKKAKAIVAAAPKDPAWHFIALRPAKGFEFTTEARGLRLDASQLHFDPMESSQRPELLGLLIYCPNSLANVESIVEVMWHVIETGIGEEAARLVAAIKVESQSRRPGGALPISDLSDFIRWWQSKHSKHT